MVVRVVLVDDQELVRAGIRSLLHEAGYSVAEGSDCDQIETLLDSHQPDVLLLNLTTHPGLGLETLSRLRKSWPLLPVILFSMQDSCDDVIKAMQAGASGYLLQSGAVIELQLAVQSVLDGYRYLSPRVVGQVIDAASGKATESSLELLTSRQREVLYWLAKGKSNKEIAVTLSLSVKTVDTHRAQIMERLGVRDLAGLVMYALRRGIVTLHE